MLTKGRARRLSGLNVLLIFAVYALQGRYSGSKLPPWYAVFHPVGSSLLSYAVVRSVLVILANGGLEWRGTRYPLELLKSNYV